MSHETRTGLTAILGCSIALAALLLLAGCGIRPNDRILLEYRRSGGIAGVDDRLIIYADGRAILTRKDIQHEIKLTSSQMSALKRELDEADFRSLETTLKLNSASGYDLFQYELTYQGRTVRTWDGAVPQQLQPIIESLNSIVQAPPG